jgi:hypothetical protein
MVKQIVNLILLRIIGDGLNEPRLLAAAALERVYQLGSVTVPSDRDGDVRGVSHARIPRVIGGIPKQFQHAASAIGASEEQ